jgi:alpha-beta hydrolase superfamily lysophospholipase
MWLRDSVPVDFPQLRVWLYGYDSSLTDTDSVEDFYEYAQTLRRLLRGLRRKTKLGVNQGAIPIIFIAHSLGGLLLKEVR